MFAGAPCSVHLWAAMQQRLAPAEPPAGNAITWHDEPITWHGVAITWH